MSCRKVAFGQFEKDIYFPGNYDRGEPRKSCLGGNNGKNICLSSDWDCRQDTSDLENDPVELATFRTGCQGKWNSMNNEELIGAAL